MKIIFSTNTYYTIENLRQLALTPEVGFDPDFWSDARLIWLDEEGNLLQTWRMAGADAQPVELAEAEASLHPQGTIGNLGKTFVPEDFSAGPRWLTAMSGFSYQLIGRYGGRDVWVYEGAGNGFLKQNLLPPMDDPRVVRVDGTFGLFIGPDALDHYNAEKKHSKNL